METSPADHPVDPEARRMKSARARGFAIELVRQLVVPTFVLDAESRVVVWNKAC